MDEDFLNKKLLERTSENALRTLRFNSGMADYYSNDYLGIVKNRLIEKQLGDSEYPHGSTGSRLLSGNDSMTEETEVKIASFHDAASALIFNSGYDANFGLLSCIARRGDKIIYDKLCHASIRDGIRQSFADSRSFIHNSLEDLEKKLKNRKGICFVVTESVFSMDGDLAPLDEIAKLCETYQSHLIVDEAHATGIIGHLGEGAVQLLGIQHRCFARIHTFGKALGCHGAVILGSPQLREYLINFCRPFIYSTAMPPASIAAIRASYEIFPGLNEEREKLKKLMSLFNHPVFSKSDSPIQCFIKSGNENIKRFSSILAKNNLDVRPVLHPTVPIGEERLRITLHSFNNIKETQSLVSILTENL